VAGEVGKSPELWHALTAPSPRSSSRGEGWGEGLFPQIRKMRARRVPLTRIASVDAIRPRPARGRAIAYEKYRRRADAARPSPVEQTQRPFPLRFCFVLDPIPCDRLGKGKRREAKQWKRLRNSICDSPAACGERSDHIARCDPGEGYRSDDSRRSRGGTPHPDPLRASFARLDPASAGRGRKATTSAAVDRSAWCHGRPKYPPAPLRPRATAPRRAAGRQPAARPASPRR
jgi:hypothetical protein